MDVLIFFKNFNFMKVFSEDPEIENFYSFKLWKKRKNSKILLRDYDKIIFGSKC